MSQRVDIAEKLKNDTKTEEDGLTINQANSRNVKDIKNLLRITPKKKKN